MNKYVERYFSGPPVGHGTLHASPSRAPDAGSEPSPTHSRTATMGPSSSSVTPTQAPQAKRSLPYHPERYVYARSEGVASVHSGSAISDKSQGMSRRLAQTVWPEGEEVARMVHGVSGNPQRVYLAKAKSEALQRGTSGPSTGRMVFGPSTHTPADVGFPRYTGWTPVLNPLRRAQPVTPTKAPPRVRRHRTSCKQVHVRLVEP